MIGATLFDRMVVRRFLLFACAVIAGFAGMGGFYPASAARQQTALQVLDRIQPGLWEIRLREDGGVQRLCLGDRRQLIQLRHPDIPCATVVLEDTASSLTVQYTCRGRGYGRTHIRMENSQLFQLESQGIGNGLPFEFSAEGRRVGGCSL